MRFEDYHRTVVGYHGTRLSVALDIVSRKRGFKYSRNRDDWLGHGIYFWEYAPQQALWWAERRRRRQKWDEPIAILASMIRLGYCLDLLDPYNVKFVIGCQRQFAEAETFAGRSVPKNANHHKYLDCAVFQYLYDLTDDVRPIDSARAVYVPTGGEKRVWDRSWISQDAHIQVCVRNKTSILGTWLHPIQPGGLDEEEASEVADVGDESYVGPDLGPTQEDVSGGEDPDPGQSGADDSGGGGSGQAAPP